MEFARHNNSSLVTLSLSQIASFVWWMSETAPFALSVIFSSHCDENNIPRFRLLLLRYPSHFQKDAIRGICCSANISVCALKINAVEHMRSDILQT